MSELGVAIETSGLVGSVALLRGPVVVDERRFPHGLRNAAALIPLIDAMLRDAGETPAGVSRLYVSVGPGSFTGLRIGLTAAKTWAFVTGAKIVPVPTARVMVENLPPEAAHAITALDAKRGQVFTARYQRTSGGWEEVEPAHLDTLVAMIARSPRPVSVLGEGLAHHPLPPDADGVTAASAEQWPARAAAAGVIGYALAERGVFADPLELVPTYVRLPEAVEKWQIAAGAAATAES